MDYEVSLPKYLMQALQSVQKRVMSIICPGHSCHEALDITITLTIKELATHHDEIRETLFDITIEVNDIV